MLAIESSLKTNLNIFVESFNLPVIRYFSYVFYSTCYVLHVGG